MNFKAFRLIWGFFAPGLALLCSVSAAPKGYVVKLAKQWTVGPVSVHELSTGKEWPIDDGKCYGPSFSPDGSKVVYAKQTNGDKEGDIFIKNSDGTGEAVAQGFSVPTQSGGGTEPCVNWVVIDGVDYLYWSLAEQDIYRAKLGSAEQETIYTTDKGGRRLICISVSGQGPLAGKRFACTINGWSAFQIDIGSNTTHSYGGCQGSVSATGKYLVRNIGGHKATYIHDFDTHEKLAEVATPEGTVNWQRFSRSTDDYFCVTVNKGKAYICNWNTKEYTEAGPGSPLDYYHEEVPGFGNLAEMENYTPALTSIAIEPKTISLAPLGNIMFEAKALDQMKKLLATQPAISYTAQAGTINPSGLYIAPAGAGQYQVFANSGAMSDTATVTVDASIVPGYKLTSPNQGESFKVGETITITWESNSTLVTDAGLSVSLDGGVTETGIVTKTLTPEQDDWGAYEWVVPFELSGVPLAGKQIMIKVHEYYGTQYYDYSDLPIKIIDPSSVGKPAVGPSPLYFPTQNMITVNTSNPYRVSISDLAGKEHYQYRNSSPHTLMLQQIGLAEGVYVVRLESGSRAITKTLSYFKVK
jgi:hypothetical protein